ncbi:Protein kinase domain, partial [Dillenia turbinata]
MLNPISSLFLILLSFYTSLSASSSPSSLSKDALAILAFKSKADLGNILEQISFNSTSTFCKWQGVTCSQGRATRFVLENFNLRGLFAPNTLTHLDQLRVLSLQNNSLTGQIPNLSGLTNLKTLFLDHNLFSGSFPPSLSSLHRLRTIDFSYNNLTGLIPSWLTNLDRLYCLQLDFNRFTGSVPPLNQSTLQIFNVSNNNLTGPIPITAALVRFTSLSFSSNPSLCGAIIHRECSPRPPFFGPSSTAVVSPPPPTALGQKQNEDLQGVGLTEEPNSKKHKRTVTIIGFASGVFVLVSSLLCFVLAVNKQRKKQRLTTPNMAGDYSAAAEAEAVMRMEEENELEQKVKKVQEIQAAKTGSLVFCAGEPQLYTMDQLMKASAELLGRGTIGTTYKAVLDNRLIVSVKRLDASKTAGTGNEVFEHHMESVGGLRHPNLVPLRAYFQANTERLLIYDYQPNGSLFSLIHGSKSTRAKPLHWTSCLKIAEDIAQGLSYIHQAWRLVHGNLKSSNVLLGPDFEACLTDYCLVVITDSAPGDEMTSSRYKAPETCKPQTPATSKSDVYSFGILLLELLTGKHPSQHPFLMPNDLVNWVRSIREDDVEDSRLEMLLEVAVACSTASPEQRPTMWQVLKMIQEIKETIVLEDSVLDPSMDMP